MKYLKVATPPTGGYHAQPAVSVPTIGEPSVVVTQTPMLPRQAPAKVNPSLLVLVFFVFLKGTYCANVFKDVKGVKRKADTTTPTANALDPLYTPVENKAAKIPTRRESGRQIKKPRSSDDGLGYASAVPIGLPVSGTASGSSKEKLSEALKSCNEILKELFSKKHSVSGLKYFFLIRDRTWFRFLVQVRIFTSRKKFYGVSSKKNLFRIFQVTRYFL